MNLGVSSNWLSSDVQTCIELLQIPCVRPKEVQEKVCEIIKVNMRCNPASVVSETYEFKMTIFENGSPEEILQFLTNVKKSIKETVTTAVLERINFIRTLLCGKDL